MDLSISREVYYLIAAICFLVITIFLCWALFEVARLFRRANHLVDEADTKLHEIESTIRGLLERITSFTSYAAILGEGIKSIMGYLTAKAGEGLEEIEEEHDKKKKRK